MPKYMLCSLSFGNHFYLFIYFWQPLLSQEVNVSHFQWWWMPLFSPVFGIIIDTYILFQFSFFFILKLSQTWPVGALSSSLFFWYDLIILFLFPCCSTIRCSRFTHLTSVWLLNFPSTLFHLYIIQEMWNREANM